MKIIGKWKRFLELLWLPITRCSKEDWYLIPQLGTSHTEKLYQPFKIEIAKWTLAITWPIVSSTEVEPKAFGSWARDAVHYTTEVETNKISVDPNKIPPFNAYQLWHLKFIILLSMFDLAHI